MTNKRTMMINGEELTQEFRLLVSKYYPGTRSLIQQCYIKILECYIERLGKRLYYLGVYYPDGLVEQLESKKYGLKEIAENMGLVEVVYINATPLVRDPISKLKQENPRLWLELYWIVMKAKSQFIE